MPELRDILDRLIEVGDHVVYGTTVGRSPMVRVAVVEKITWTREVRYKHQHGPTPAKSTTPHFSTEEIERRLDLGEPGPMWRRYDHRLDLERSQEHPFGRITHEYFVDVPKVRVRAIKSARWQQDQKPMRPSYPTPGNLVKIEIPEDFE